MSIRAVVLDCFGVLYSSAVGDFLSLNIKDYKSHKKELNDLAQQADYGLISQDEYVRSIAELSGLSVEFVRKGVLGGLVRNERLLEYSKGLRDRYKIGFLSNISMHTMSRFFSKEELEQFFDEVVISSEVGMIKPHPEIFEFMASKLDVDTSEVVMIDDNKANCEGAIASGMKAIVYRDFESTKRELESLLRL